MPTVTGELNLLMDGNIKVAIIVNEQAFNKLISEDTKYLLSKVKILENELSKQQDIAILCQAENREFRGFIRQCQQ